MKKVTLLTLIALAAFAPPPASPQALSRSGTDMLVVRYACLIGGREAGTAPTSAGVLSRKELVDFLLEWQPEADNDEMRQVFALNNLGELMRRASLLPAAGGSLSGAFTLGDSEFEIAMKIRPARRATYMGMMGSPFKTDVGSELRISAEIRRGGERLLGPAKILHYLGERAIITYTKSPEAPFLFLVVEAGWITPEELSRGPRHSWGVPSARLPRDGEILLVDGDEVSAPIAIDKTRPTYTAAAKEAGHQGRVVLRTVIDEEGTVVDVEVLEGQPYGLSEAAVAAVRTWRFRPARHEGEPVAVNYLLTINFRPE